MRGRDDRSEGLFSYVRLEERIPADHPLRAIRGVGGRGFGGAERAVRGAVLGDGPAVDPAGDAAAGDAAAGVLLGPLGAAADGADQLQPVVPLVRRPVDGRARCGMPTVFTHNRDRLLEARGGARASWRAVLALPQVKALLSDEHFSVDGTLIEAWASMKSFRPKDGSGEPPGTGAQRRAQLPQGEALERDACLDHRSGCAALSQGRRPREPAVLHGPRADGEPQRPGGGCRADARHRDGGAGGGAGHARPPRTGRPHHARRRQGLRRRRPSSRTCASAR